MTTEVMNNLDSEAVNWYEEDCPVTHGFAPGVYLREIFMPAGTYVIGKEHNTEHFNTILKGSAYVMIDDNVEFMVAPMSFVSHAGCRKVLYIVEDMIWQTIHPTEETNIEVLENTLVSDKKPDINMLLPPSDLIRIGSM